MFAFVGGILAAQVPVAMIAFGGFGRETWSAGEPVEYYGYAAVHLVSVAAGICVGWGVGAALNEEPVAAGMTGFAAVFVYELLLGLELLLLVAGDERERNSS